MGRLLFEFCGIKSKWGINNANVLTPLGRAWLCEELEKRRYIESSTKKATQGIVCYSGDVISLVEELYEVFKEEIFSVIKRVVHLLPQYDFYMNGSLYGRFEKKLDVFHDTFSMKTRDEKKH